MKPVLVPRRRTSTDSLFGLASGLVFAPGSVLALEQSESQMLEVAVGLGIEPRLAWVWDCGT